MATVIDTLVTKFRFESDKSGLKKVESGITSFKSSVVKLGAAILTAIGGIEFIRKVSESEESMLQLAKALGITTEQLDTLEFAAKKSGVSMGDLETSLENMSAVLGQAARGVGAGVEIFGRFGLEAIDTNGHIENTVQFLDQVNRRFQTLSSQQQFDLGRALGLSPRMIKLLSKTPEEFRKLEKEARRFGVTSEKDAELGEKYQDSLKDLTQSMQKLGEIIGRYVFPVLTLFNESLVSVIQWMRKNASFVKIFIGVLGSLAAAFTYLKREALLGWAAALAPLAAVAAAIGVVSVAIQDVWYYFKGLPSVTGKIVKSFQALEDSGTPLGLFLKGLAAVLKLLWSAFNGLAALIKNTFVMAFKDAIAVVDKLWSLINRFSKTIKKWNPFSKLKNWEPFKFLGKKLGLNFKVKSASPAQPPVLSSTAVSAARSGPTSVSTPTVNVGGITVHSQSGDPVKIAAEVSRQIGGHLKNAVENVDSSIVR